MSRTAKRFTNTTASILMLAMLSACHPGTSVEGGQKSTEAEYQLARQEYARAAERLAKEAKPITDREALARKLKLSADRFGVIKTGPRAGGPLVVAFDQGSDCKFGHCTCVGDRDCNEMFSGICRNPSTDGYCEGSGDSTICSCKYSTGEEDTETPTPTEPG